MNDYLAQHFRYPESYYSVAHQPLLSGKPGYFGIGREGTCFGRYASPVLRPSPALGLHDALRDIHVEHNMMSLPFDLAEVMDNLRLERYKSSTPDNILGNLLSRMYYWLRPAMPFQLRSRLKKLHLRDWESLPFPHWPVDFSADNLMDELLLCAVKAHPEKKIPFIWFWPQGAPSCVIMTHDVETEFGKQFCSTLMDIDASFGISSSFQVVPEERYVVDSSFLASIRSRNFEVVIHDLNHDGHLFRDRKQFLARAKKINEYGRLFKADGFRSAILYRNQAWYDALDFSYDMSVPNVAHLDPQRGGCCTVMPYFIGDILELPVTTTQDYMLFHMLGDYSISLWEQQIAMIHDHHGLINFIVHPDYVERGRERHTYETLLSHLARLRDDTGAWITTPGEVNKWWRQRARMTLSEAPDGTLTIDGPGSDRACIALATEHAGRLTVSPISSSKDLALHAS